MATETPSQDEAALLLADARQGDAEAFCRLAGAGEERLWRQALALCGDAHEAEDLAAETMVEAWRSLGRFDGSCRFSTWLYAILVHRHLKLVRHRRSRPVSLAWLPAAEAEEQAARLARVPDPRPLAPDLAARHEQDAKLKDALAELPATHHAVLLLRFFEDATLPEIAAALGIPVGTVKSRLHHGLSRLRAMESVMNLLETGGDE